MRPDVPAALIKLLDRMMAKDPAKRYQTAEELAGVLAEWRPPAQRLKRAVPLPGPEHIDFTAEAIAKARSSPEGRKGLEAFFAKAPPAWAARVEALRKSSAVKK